MQMRERTDLHYVLYLFYDTFHALINLRDIEIDGSGTRRMQPQNCLTVAPVPSDAQYILTSFISNGNTYLFHFEEGKKFYNRQHCSQLNGWSMHHKGVDLDYIWDYNFCSR